MGFGVCMLGKCFHSSVVLVGVLGCACWLGLVCGEVVRGVRLFF